MNNASRPIDEAMAAGRLDKQQVRAMWGTHVKHAANGLSTDETLYLTLAGAYGHDVRYLVEIGVIEVTETGAVAPSETSKIVAVERGTTAYTALRERFPGLTVMNKPIELLAGGDQDPTVYPGKKDKVRNALRARVVNLDYNQPFLVNVDDTGWLRYPQLILIEKLAQLHASTNPVNWILLLTLNGHVEWPPSANDPVREYLAENIDTQAAFAADAKRCLGEDLVNNIADNDTMDFAKFSPREQQLIISALVPKKIATLVHNSGWKTSTVANLNDSGVRRG